MPTDDAVPLRRPLRDPDGFVDLYRREGERVLLFCTRRVLEPETALDLTAETFAEAYVGRRRFRGSTEVEARAWLLTIARRRIARYLDRGRLDRRLVERLGIRTPTLDPGESEEILRRADVDRVRATIAAGLERLTDDQRAALQLRIVEERSYEDVAASLGISEQTARARVSRGLRALAASLEPRLTAEGDRA